MNAFKKLGRGSVDDVGGLTAAQALGRFVEACRQDPNDEHTLRLSGIGAVVEVVYTEEGYLEASASAFSTPYIEMHPRNGVTLVSANAPKHVVRALNYISTTISLDPLCGFTFEDSGGSLTFARFKDAIYVQNEGLPRLAA